MFALGDLEHSLMFFHRVSRKTGRKNINAENGIQRCLEAIKFEINNMYGSKEETKTVGKKHLKKNNYFEDKLFLKVGFSIFKVPFKFNNFRILKKT